MLTFEGARMQGPENIVAKLSTLGSVVHQITFLDCQPFPGNGILVCVGGQLSVISLLLVFMNFVCRLTTITL